MELNTETAVSLAKALEVKLGASQVQSNAEFGSRTSYRVGGVAGVLVELGSIADLETLGRYICGEGLAVLALGRGSNMLVSDNGFPGVVVLLGSSLAALDIGESGEVQVGAGASLPVLARQLTSAGISGFEWAVGIPGSVGGAVRMNAGGHGDDMSGSVRRVKGVDFQTGERFELAEDELQFNYRSSSLLPHQIVVSVDLILTEGDPARGRKILNEVVRWRRENQPGGQNAGSVFTNPTGDSAGRLIDIAGLKGFRSGSACISTKHANFIQVDDGGKAADVVAVMFEVSRRVFDMTGVTLKAETRLVGFGPTERALMFDAQSEL